MKDNHLTNDELQMFVDGKLPKAEAEFVAKHLHHCARCASAHFSLKQVDITLRNLSPEHLGGDFTRTLMAKLTIVSHSSFLFRAVENLAYVFGMMIVLGIMLTVFVLSGVVNSAHVSQTRSFVGAAGDTVHQQFTTFTNSLTSLLQTYLPFVFGNGSLKIAVMGTLAIGGIALLDKFLKRRMH